MPKRYEVLERSFINGRLYEPGETLVLEIDSPGGNLKQVGGAAPTASKTIADAPEYTAKHNGGGRYIIIDKSGERVGMHTGNKDEAEAEAARLNDGGEITPTASKTNADQDDTTDSTLPDA